jgi:imidazole glycerol-phosphate synthase subunit HisH
MIVIIDYGMGNLGSVANMLKKIGAKAVVSSDPKLIADADKLILPGVGAFDNGMRNLAERGLIPVLNTKIFQDRTPILGLCLGMQLFSSSGEEGQLPGLGWLDARAVRFNFSENLERLKIPHMGWNTLQICQPHSLVDAMSDDTRFYFVHSYHVVCSDVQNVLAQTHYGYDFVSAVVKDNILGVQFHPEKSHKFGMQLLKNFVERC